MGAAASAYFTPYADTQYGFLGEEGETMKMSGK